MSRCQVLNGSAPHLQIFDPWLPWIFRSSHGSMGSTGPFLQLPKLPHALMETCSENWMSWTQNLERIPRKLDKSWCFHVSMCRKAKLDSKKNSFSVAFLLFLSPWIIISTPYQDIVRAIDPNSLFFLPPLCFQKTTKFELAWTSKNQKNMASWRTCQLPPKSYNKHHWNTIPFLSK